MAIRIFDIPAAGGAAIDVAFSIPARRVEIRENALKADGVTANAPQGFQCSLTPDGTSSSVAAKYTRVVALQATEEPLILGNVVGHGGGIGPLLGLPEQNAANGAAAFNHRAADLIVHNLISLGAASTVEVVEYE
jgi:hypothetical protein